MKKVMCISSVSSRVFCINLLHETSYVIAKFCTCIVTTTGGQLGVIISSQLCRFRTSKLIKLLERTAETKLISITQVPSLAIMKKT